MDVVPRQRQQMADSSLEYNMSTQVRCPYDPVHVIVRRKMPAHLAKCSKVRVVLVLEVKVHTVEMETFDMIYIGL